MGCRNACICSGRCSESCYEAEKYCGEAEDIYDELHGKSKEEEEYYKAMEEQYYKDMEEQEEYYKAMEEQYYKAMEEQEERVRQICADNEE